jgi:putative transcriptional regulator
MAVVKARLNPDGTVSRLKRGRWSSLRARVDRSRVARTSEVDIAAQAAADEREARADAGAHARRIRTRLKLSQAEFARRIGVSVETVRNWEQGKRFPDQAARSLLRVVEREPDAVFRALAR